MKKPVYYFLVIIFSFAFFENVLAEVKLNVPFSVQAPYGHWSAPWDNACEETSTVMIDLFYQNYNERNIPAEVVAPRILQLVKNEDVYFGFNEDTNANQIATIINNFLSWEAKVVKNPTLEQLKHEIDVGHPFILPASGPDLHNPYYNSDHVDYHAFVVSGYDNEKREFIVQEPATVHGLDLRYSYDTIMTAMHDFLPNNKTYKGAKVAVFTSPKVIASKDIDADNDGLTKEEELKYGTILFFSDSDGDGYKDGQEVKSGYSPTISEPKLLNDILVKAPKDPKVYLIENDKKRWITSEEAFLRHGWKWKDIKTIKKSFLENNVPDGEVIDY